ncbi:MAG: hypothetical protein JRC87_04680 [Deltaproteobacteria bacterium]|nr:hypothetical protein [Deltaproteobacteria bacterium]MBW2658884.1 hypothetical protein [Deltaproteobacteria bacterium]
MKNNSITIETISANSLIQWPGRNILKQIFPAVRHLYASYSEQIKYCLATLVVGAIFLGSIFIFFVQLAEYGW